MGACGEFDVQMSKNTEGPSFKGDDADTFNFFLTMRNSTRLIFLNLSDMTGLK
jgi:hypothetical protein